MSKPDSSLPLDRSQFFSLFTEHTRRIYGHIRTLVPNQADAEDIFQETSAILWEKFEDFEPGTNFAAWACQIAYYRVLNHRHRKSRQPVAFSDELLEVVDQEMASMSHYLASQHRALADCYEKLSERDKRLIDSRYRDGASVKELAEGIGKSLRSTYRMLERIYAALLDCIQYTLEESNSK